ncbi:YggT family protein [Rothia sp. CCM 9417]|uniref:YggT family protein n=1 Tax=unclassified Rothia (in: high G+C Gram-positive bacteria) TaxID=2689056 RepID=UPI003ACF71E0
MGYIFAVLAVLVYLLIVLFMVRLVFDWVQMFARYWRPRGLALILASLVYSVTDPPMNLARRYIKPLNLGSFSLDLGFMILLMALFIGYQLLISLTASFS